MFTGDAVAVGQASHREEQRAQEHGGVMAADTLAVWCDGCGMGGLMKGP